MAAGMRAVTADGGSRGGSTADAQAAVRSRDDGRGHITGGLRIRKREIDIAAAVNGEVVDAPLPDGLRDFGFARFNWSGFRGNRHRLLHAFEVQAQIE